MYLKQKRWGELLALSTSHLETYDESSGWQQKDALRIFRYVSDAVAHLPPSDEVDGTLDRLRKDKRFAGLEGLKPILLRAVCTSLNRKKDYGELCGAAREYAEELLGKEGTRKQAADMFRLSAIAYNNLGRHEEARDVAREGVPAAPRDARDQPRRVAAPRGGVDAPEQVVVGERAGVERFVEPRPRPAARPVQAPEQAARAHPVRVPSHPLRQTRRNPRAGLRLPRAAGRSARG